MASAVWLGSSKLARKSRAVFERPQHASPAHRNLRLPKMPWHGGAVETGDELLSSRSSPYFTFTSEDTEGESSLTPPSPPIEKSAAAWMSPALSSRARPSPLTLEPPSHPGLVVEPLEGGASAVSLLGDDIPHSPSSAGLRKDWRQMQVSEPHPPSCKPRIYTTRVRACVYVS